MKVDMCVFVCLKYKMTIMITGSYNWNDLEKDYKDHLVITMEIKVSVLVENDEYC